MGGLLLKLSWKQETPAFPLVMPGLCASLPVLGRLPCPGHRGLLAASDREQAGLTCCQHWPLCAATGGVLEALGLSQGHSRLLPGQLWAGVSACPTVSLGRGSAELSSSSTLLFSEGCPEVSLKLLNSSVLSLALQ